MIRASVRPVSWCCGAILAGGRSSRMGVPKAGMLLPDGRSMIETVRDTAVTVCDQCVLVGGRHGLGGHAVIEDHEEHGGPLAALVALLASGHADHYLVFACDQPLLDPAFAARLLVDRDAAAVTFANADGRPIPLPLRIAAEAADVVDETLAAGERSLRALLHRLDARARSVEHRSTGALALTSVNTPEEFETLCRALFERE